ncbi:Nsp1-like C-terminal region-domain-containing protein [Cantharellus anzutake]|uniref:Nsp1-like C-terminal region-domain-containing protein n=1 Tax=Cantharellus anzutake TaxID=1750568 RepID=UPI0019057595|nr:Nsp1-like C-terminal region-domain-containing protein [Cantharellus anzutake]KAF8338724.1 Nsp1-like C-terminal region-domain-containing protein [Cantharellus anzutake]
MCLEVAHPLLEVVLLPEQALLRASEAPSAQVLAPELLLLLRLRPVAIRSALGLVSQQLARRPHQPRISHPPLLLEGSMHLPNLLQALLPPHQQQLPLVPHQRTYLEAHLQQLVPLLREGRHCLARASQRLLAPQPTCSGLHLPPRLQVSGLPVSNPSVDVQVFSASTAAATGPSAPAASPSPFAGFLNKTPASAPSTGTTPAPGTSESTSSAPAPAKPSPFGGTFASFAPPTASTTSDPKDKEKEKEKAAGDATTKSDATKPAEDPKPTNFMSAFLKAQESSKSTSFTPGPSTSATPATAAPSTSTAQPAGTTASTTTAPGPPPSMLRGKTIDEIIAKWNNELETQVKQFHKVASEVAVWDRALMENSEKINFLFNKVTAAQASQVAIDESLKHIEEQQRALNKTLDGYEEIVKQILNNSGRSLDLGPADRERDNSYGLAAGLNSQLDDLSHSLTSMIETVNSLSAPPDFTSGAPFSAAGAVDPIAQIEAILNAHLGSLQWIDGAVKELEVKVKEVEIQQESSSSDGFSSTSYGYTGRGFGLGPTRR